MSLGAELLMRSIADSLEDAVFLSEFGDGCPLLDEAAKAVMRMARRPVGGIIRRDGFVTLPPPVDLFRRGDDCQRLAQHGLLIVDTTTAQAAELLEIAKELAPDRLAALRIRGEAFSSHPLQLVFEDNAGRDHVYLHEDLIASGVAGNAIALKTSGIDEFDAFSSFIGAGNVIKSLRHGAAHSEVVLYPAAMLDQPDAGQIAAALGEGHVVMAADGGCALIAPQLSGAPQPVSVTIADLEAASPNPLISLPNAPEWTIDAHREGSIWKAVASPNDGATSLVSLFVEIEVAESLTAEVTEVTTAVTRKRGAWEVWDEAQTQLELEKSW